VSTALQLELRAIDRDGTPRDFGGRLPDVAASALHATAQLYRTVGYCEPWVGYLAIDGGRAVGTCGFKAPPAAGRVEIAYFTFPEFEGRGVATAMARRLTDLALEAQPGITVAAQTLPMGNASNAILRKLGFRCVGTATDDEAGEVWEWQLPVVLRTPRLHLRRMNQDDAEFIIELLNDAAFLRYIGDKGVRTVEDARKYVLTGPIASYQQFGFGLYLVESRDSGERLGMCGLLKRDTLEDVDIGFAFLPQHRSKGFAVEAAAAVMRHARASLGLGRIVAITSQDNEGSAKVLKKIGFKYERLIQLPHDESELKLFASEVAPATA
jgi:RimJ/RimL family protein N-acetyltransferase